ncbi:phage tail protein [Psychrobacter faecalis]|uniref:Phage tail protein n=1 Tax=Psychrobacter faecalis TaxID=180588 RepID=A0ABT9HJD4_9GAMM|nr:phage tail protein [Psychrobacter faecalis]MDP4545891.1 phage tail protein [Psychrobacter faecalis]
MSLSLIQGAKAGQEKPHQPSIAKDDVASISKVKILYVTTEGEARGLANGSASIMLDGTPLFDAEGNPNFENVEWEIRHGTVDQTHIAGLPSLSSEIGIGTILRSGTPWIRTITNTQLSSANVNISWSRLSETTDKFDVIGTKVDYAIDVQTDGNGYVTVLDTSIKAKTSGRYQRTHNIKLPEAQQGWQIRVRKITADGDNERKFNQMQIDSIAEIIDAKLRYPHSALLYLSFDARAFSNIPKMTVDMYGRYLKVPVNYDPVSRTSTGIWTGEFKTDYTNNPAWVYYDLITNDRYGLGDRLKPFMINKWAIAHIARICDEPVSDGKGGTEPRFTCNLYLQVAEQAYQVLQHIAAIFRGMSFWDGAQIVLDADTPRDADYVITRANVVDGAFVKSGTAIDDRHTLVQVAWSNPDNNYETDYVTVRNERAIAKYGINPLDMPVVGCTSEGQAYRAGLAALLSEQNRTQTLTFAMGLDGSLPSVGSRVDIADMMFTGANNGGRISAVNANYTVITVDRDDIPAKAGDRLSVNLESGRAQTREILSVSGRNITVKAAFDPVAAENVWAVDSDELPTMPFIVLSITENEDRTQYTYTALQYDAGLYAQIDNGTIIEQRPPVPPMNPYIIQAPDSVTVSSRNRVVQAQNVTTFIIVWDQVKDAVAYDVEWRKDDGDWIKLPRTGNISAEIDGVYSGNYLARVRAVSAFDAISKPTTSMLTAITGKAGKPPKLLSIKAIGLLFGMQLDWRFAPGSGDTAYTEIQVASAPDVNVAPLGQFAFNTDTHTVNGLQGGLTQHYRGRIVDKLGNTSDWTSWVSGTTDANADKIMDLIQGQIDESSLNDILTSKIADIEINKDAISQETQGRIQAIIDANKRITDEAKDRVEALRLASLRTDDLQNFADDLANDVDTVTLAQAQTANGLAVVKERADAFEIENGLQAQRLTYLSSEINSGYTDATKYTDKSRGTVWTFAKAVAHADYVNAQSIQGLSADYQNSSARFTEEINLLTTKNEAVATKTTNLSAQMVGGYDGNDLTKLNSGLLFEESKARATDVEGLAEQISLLSAGVGEQFDSFEIWHFNKDKDGWTGGTYNSGGWLNVRAETITSPTITDLDGAVYKHIKLRIKKVGTPTWQGLLSYTGGSKTITEPSYDADGVALVNWQLEWSGDITSFNLKLASAGDNLNYYSIDWIAVGRPSPGASNASLLRESKVRASETSANANDLIDLRSKIEGGNGVPIESSITKKLETTANLASTTADEVSTLKSTYDDDMYGYEGTVQTTARTLASATQAEAERLDLLSANVLPSYTDATKYTDAKRSTQWTYAKTVAADNYAANQRITNLQSDFDNSTSNINKELFTLTEKDKSIAADITQLYAETGENYGLIQEVSIAISKPGTGLAAKVTELQSSAKSNSDAAAAAQDAANDAADAAGNKGEVIYSTTEPSADKQKAQNLWIDASGGKNTPKRWAGAQWLSVTDKAATDAQKAADAANQKLEPANLASLVEGSGAFSDEFGSISGQFANFEAVVEGQKTAMEVISGIGNAEKLKNEIAKARLDKNVTNLNAQSTALTNQINSYTAKIAELTTKRNAPKPPDMTQERYLALKAEYQKQIDDITAAKSDLTAQKSVIADQVAQLAAEQKVLDDFKEVEDGVRAQHTVKIDNAGKIVGFGFVLQKDGFSAFDVRADRFSISAPSDKPNDVNGTSPFMVLTNPQVIDGVTVPAGTYMRNFYAPKGSIDTLQVKDGAIKSAKIANLAVDSAQIAGQAITVTTAVTKAIFANGVNNNPFVPSGQTVSTEAVYLNAGGPNPVFVTLHLFGANFIGTANKQVQIEFFINNTPFKKFITSSDQRAMTATYTAICIQAYAELQKFSVRITSEIGNTVNLAEYTLVAQVLKK